MRSCRFLIILFFLIAIGLGIVEPLCGQCNYDHRNETSNTGTGVRTILWIPVGKLAKTFNPSPGFEFEIGPRVADARVENVNLYCSFILPNGNSFKLNTGDTLVNSRSNLLLITALRWREEEFMESGFFNFTTTFLGVGAATFFVDKGAGGKRRAFGNIHLAIGKTFSKRILTNQCFGITVQYNLIPKRGLPGNVNRSFGNSSVSLGLEYRF